MSSYAYRIYVSGCLQTTRDCTFLLRSHSYYDSNRIRNYEQTNDYVYEAMRGVTEGSASSRIRVASESRPGALKAIGMLSPCAWAKEMYRISITQKTYRISTSTRHIAT